VDEVDVTTPWESREENSLGTWASGEARSANANAFLFSRIRLFAIKHDFGDGENTRITYFCLRVALPLAPPPLAARDLQGNRIAISAISIDTVQCCDIGGRGYRYSSAESIESRKMIIERGTGRCRDGPNSISREALAFNDNDDFQRGASFTNASD